MGKPSVGPVKVYAILHESMGRLDWWPVSHGFKPAELEVCIGAILTQNTNWLNVEKALANLEMAGIASLEDLNKIRIEELESLIRPSGFFRQKAARLKAFTGFVMSFGSFNSFKCGATRQQLLGVSGLGPETVDSILLYALERPEFVIDAYTRRVFNRLGMNEKWDYDGWKGFFEENLPRDVDVYRQFHALIVQLSKSNCRSSAVCEGCPLESRCPSRRVIDCN